MRNRSSRGVSDRLIMWSASVLALFAGCYIALYQLQATIDLQHELTDRLAATARGNAAVLAARAELEQSDHVLDAHMRELDLNADHATTVAHFIRACSAITAAHHIALVQIDERAPAPADVHHSPLAGDNPYFETIPLDVTLRGSYRDLLASIRALSQAPVAMQIEIANIERTTSTTSDAKIASLTGRLRVSIVRLSDPNLPASFSIAPGKDNPHA